MRVCLIGYGKMGSALLSGWLEQDAGYEFSIIEPYFDAEVRQKLEQSAHVTWYENGAELEAGTDFDVVVLAVKPQIMGDVLAGCRHIGTSDTVFVSIAAGLSIETLQGYIPQSQAIIRAMPNSPAKVQMGITAMVASTAVTPEMEDAAKSLLCAIGEVVDIDDENLMDAVTAVSGSGPAYVFYLVEAMAQAGLSLGLDEKTAMILARQTVIGAGQLMAGDEADASTLRQNVTSEGGTTAAALSVLMADEGLSPLMEKALTAARNRGVELSKA